MVSSVSKIFLILACGFSLATASTCGGNCPSGTCTTCHCGTSPSSTDIAAACARYTGWSQACCQCIARAESGGNSNAQLHNNDGTDDVGLWQINSSNWGQCSGGAAPCSLDANLACAKKVWAWGGNTWKYWSTCGKCGCCSKAAEAAFLLSEGNPEAAAALQ